LLIEHLHNDWHAEAEAPAVRHAVMQPPVLQDRFASCVCVKVLTHCALLEIAVLYVCVAITDVTYDDVIVARRPVTASNIPAMM
jgi:hypothetical protein